MKIITLNIILLLIISSCVSEKEILTKIDSKNFKNNVEIQNDYLNKNINNNLNKNLIQILNYHHDPKIFKNYYSYSDSTIVNITFNGVNSLNISYKDTSNNIVNFNIKVKNKGNYLTFRRKVTLIPIPLFFTYYWNEKTIIYLDNENNLNLISGQTQFICIFIAGGDRTVYENKFESKKEQD